MGATGFSQGSTDVPQKQQGKAGGESAAGVLPSWAESSVPTLVPHSRVPWAPISPQPPSLLSSPHLVSETFYCWRRATATEPLRLILRKVFARFDSQARCCVHSAWPTHNTENSRNPFGVSTAHEGIKSLPLPQERSFPACWHSFTMRLLLYPRHPPVDLVPVPSLHVLPL